MRASVAVNPISVSPRASKTAMSEGQPLWVRRSTVCTLAVIRQDFRLGVDHGVNHGECVAVSKPDFSGVIGSWGGTALADAARAVSLAPGMCPCE